MDRFSEFVAQEWMLFLAAAFLLSLLLHGLFRDLTKKYKTILPVNAVKLMNGDEVAVIDVRDTKEFNEGHLIGAKQIPLDQITDRAGELEQFKNKPVLITCRTGARSDLACMKLTKLGFGQLYSLQTGIDGWLEANLPISKKKK